MNRTTGRFVIPEKVASHFHLAEGDKVADLGTGSGFFLLELSTRVGNSGSVFACEIQKSLIESLGDKIRQENLHNVHVLWCDMEEESGIKLKTGTLDAGILVNTLFLLEEKETAVKEISRVLEKGGSVFVIDWTESFAGMGPTPHHVVSKNDAITLFEGQGFVLEREYEAGDHHYGLAFRKV